MKPTMVPLPVIVTLLTLAWGTRGQIHGNDGDIQHSAVDCTSNFCKMQLSNDLEKRWRISVPSDYDSSDDMCANCEITVQLIYNGYTWIGYGVSPDGSMVGSTVVIGTPSALALEEQPTIYELKDKVPMRDWFSAGFNLDNASIKYDNENAQTIMEFTAPFNTFGVTEEDNAYRQGISLKNTTYFIYAHGNEGKIEPEYHGVNNKGFRTLENLINPDAASLADDDETSVTGTTVMDQNGSRKRACTAHGILAFLAWSVCVPLAISAAAL